MTARKVNIPLAELDLGVLHHRPKKSDQRCDYPDCPGDGSHRAPRIRSTMARPDNHGRDASRAQTQDFFWLCREHARDFNRNYNYFAGLQQQEIEAFAKDAVIGHRKTWWMSADVDGDQRLADAVGRSNFDDPFGVFSADGAQIRRSKLPAAMRKALAILDLDDTASLQEIKMRYKQLVKRLHPDVNGGDKQAEERFKKVNEAHNQLLNCGLF